MKLKKKADESGLILTLSGQALVQDADESAKAFNEVLKTPNPRVILDLEALSQVDVTFFQIVLAFQESLGEKGSKLTLRPLPPGHPVLEISELLGLRIDQRVAQTGGQA